MRKRPSDIPKGAKERLVREYCKEKHFIRLRITKCILNGRVVGKRAYDDSGRLLIDTPLRNGKKHGREYTWDEEGNLVLIEPYVKGQIHGTAKQYGQNGKIIGTYRLVHGTGFDIWRQEWSHNGVFVSEIHSLKDGVPHGYEWWLNEDKRSVWHERHWLNGEYHGIERSWKNRTLERGYPKYWIYGKRVNKRAYLQAVKKDESLPGFKEQDNLPKRQFPPKIQKIL